MTEQQFNVKSLKNDLRLKFTNSELLALHLTMNFDDAEKMSKTNDWLYEKVEINIANSWMPLKEKGIQEYHPANISLVALQQIMFYVLNFIKEVFQQSNESSQEQ